jgi:hypothetical protein
MDYSNIKMYAIGIVLYIRLWAYDMIDYYLTSLIMTIPTYMFGLPVINIRQLPDDYSSDSSDDEMDKHAIEYTVFISQLVFILKTNDSPPVMTSRTMHGAQLKTLVDTQGRFFLRHVQQHFPNIDTIILKYTKIPRDDDGVLTTKTVTRVLDVEKRCDIRTGTSCKMGVIF